MAMLDTVTQRFEQEHRRWTTPRPPGPRGALVMGMLPAFRRDPLGALEEARGAWGDIVHARIGPAHMLMLNHPDLVEQVLLLQQSKFVKDPVTHSLRYALGDGLLTSEGEVWKRQRRLCAPSLKKKHMGSYADSMVSCTLRQVDAMPARSERDVHADMMRLTLEIVAETLFGASLETESGRKVGHAVDVFMESFVQDARSWRRALPGWVPTQARLRARRAASEIDDVLYGIIRRARARQEPGDDLLSRLIEARDEDGGQMDDRQIRDEAVTIFVAGHETTALTLSYALYALALDPAVQARLHAEVDAVLGGRAATMADYGALTFTQAVVQETLRLYPPAWAIGREAVEEVEIGGYRMIPGDQCLASPWVIQRDPRWFTDPLRFDPARWLEPGFKEGLPRFAFFPFGGGARICIGNHFALMEATLALATWLQRLEVAPVAGFELQVFPAVTLRPVQGVRLHVKRRERPV